MKVDNTLLDITQKNSLALAGLYASYGYSQYKMSKFEEYDLYSKNKGFLVDESVITFTDTNGKLMALKPDVTLSIVKNSDRESRGVQKHYYNESVYRVSKSTNCFKEIMQVGLECFGEVDAYLISEVLLLAAKSLQVLEKPFILEVSHIGMVSALIEAISAEAAVQKQIWKFVNEKNAHSLMELCRRNALDSEKAADLQALMFLSGSCAEVLAALEKLASQYALEAELEELRSAVSIFEGSELAPHVRIDFSAVGNIHYYNGIIFNGFVEGVPESLLAGGQYDALMKKMKKNARAIGFAVYLDLLERLEALPEEYDADVLLLYAPQCSVQEVTRAVCDLLAQGKRVFAAKQNQSDIKAKEVYSLEKGRLILLEHNA